jgi:NAD(P)H-hydrate repair Nnr-like enzyme with NAD(P)H-hydrate epimerase domain
MKTTRRKDVPFISREQTVAIDCLTAGAFGISLIQMMENTGRNLAEPTQYLLGGTLIGQSIAVVCGSGNNGGGR